MTGRRKSRRTFGTIDLLDSGRFRARYIGPDGVRRTATRPTRGDAEAWLALRQTEMLKAEWVPPLRRSAAPFDEYAEAWLRQRDLKPRTRSEYTRLLARQIAPDLGRLPLAAISTERVREWYADLGARTGPTERTHAYQLLRTILGTAVADGFLAANPCHIRGAGQSKRSRPIRPATLDELAVIVNASPERLRLMVLLAAWCALRIGEVTELRRKDVDVETDEDGLPVIGTLRIRRAVSRIKGHHVVGTPKSAAGARDVAIPLHLLPLVVEHLDEHTQAGPDGLLFPALNGGHMTTLPRSWRAARHLAGRDDLRFHDLRHTGAVLAASTGATLAELMARLGHSSPAMAMRYQHAAAERDREIAAKLSALALTASGNSVQTGG